MDHIKEVEKLVKEVRDTSGGDIAVSWYDKL
jgi:hypothetical protein